MYTEELNEEDNGEVLRLICRVNREIVTGSAEHIPSDGGLVCDALALNVEYCGNTVLVYSLMAAGVVTKVVSSEDW